MYLIMAICLFMYDKKNEVQHFFQKEKIRHTHMSSYKNNTRHILTSQYFDTWLEVFSIHFIWLMTASCVCSFYLVSPWLYLYTSGAILWLRSFLPV